MTKESYHHGDLKNALIAAGIEILSKEGMGALSLRKVAKKVGVSHAAPYAHFADKQALIAAISTEGFRRIYEQISAASQRYAGDPPRQLVEIAWVYVEFAVRDSDHFKITLSGVIEKEKDYPAFVELSKRSFGLVVEIVQACQEVGALQPGPPELVTVGVWSLVHGFVSLLLEGQMPHAVLDRWSLRELLILSLNQVMLVELDPHRAPE